MDIKESEDNVPEQVMARGSTRTKVVQIEQEIINLEPEGSQFTEHKLNTL